MGWCSYRNTATSTPTKSTASVTRSSPTMRTSRACSAAPYFGYTTATDRYYQNTRRFLLSQDNPSFYQGHVARGIGSYHTPDHWVWPLALIVEGMTSTSGAEKQDVLEQLLASDPGDHLLHESFNPDDPAAVHARRFRLAERALLGVRHDAVRGRRPDPHGRHRRSRVHDGISTAISRGRYHSRASMGRRGQRPHRRSLRRRLRRRRAIRRRRQRRPLDRRRRSRTRAAHRPVGRPASPRGTLRRRRDRRQSANACSRSSTALAAIGIDVRASKSPIARTSCFRITLSGMRPARRARRERASARPGAASARRT